MGLKVRLTFLLSFFPPAGVDWPALVRRTIVRGKQRNQPAALRVIIIPAVETYGWL